MWVCGVTLCHMTSCTHLQDCVRDRPSDIVTEASCKGERDLLLHFHASALSAFFLFLPDLQSFNFLLFFLHVFSSACQSCPVHMCYVFSWVTFVALCCISFLSSSLFLFLLLLYLIFLLISQVDESGSFSEQSVAHALQSAKESLKWTLLKQTILHRTFISVQQHTTATVTNKYNYTIYCQIEMLCVPKMGQ